MSTRSRLMLKWYVADVKNIASEYQVTLRVDQNTATITQSFEIYDYEIATDT